MPDAIHHLFYDPLSLILLAENPSATLVLVKKNAPNTPFTLTFSESPIPTLPMEKGFYHVSVTTTTPWPALTNPLPTSLQQCCGNGIAVCLHVTF